MTGELWCLTAVNCVTGGLVCLTTVNCVTGEGGGGLAIGVSNHCKLCVTGGLVCLTTVNCMTGGFL